MGCDYLPSEKEPRGGEGAGAGVELELAYGVVIYLLQVDVGLHDLLERVAGQRGVVVQEVRERLVVLQKVLQLEIYDGTQKKHWS